MSMMFSLSEIVNATEGRLIYSNNVMQDIGTIYVTGVSKDSRTIEEGQLFVALKGEKFDGHEFCEEVKEKGAIVQLISDENKCANGTISIIVEDTVVAIGKLARYYRFKHNMKTICVTGSIGKTSTREMIALGLSYDKKVFSTKKNENNEIGLAFTILSAPEDTEILVLEMGMRKRDEISYLTNIACPDIACITNVGYCHIERLGSREEILLAKTEIIQGIQSGGFLVINDDDELLRNYCMNNLPCNMFLASTSIVGPSKDIVSVNASNITMDEEGTVFDADLLCRGQSSHIRDVRIKDYGIHHVRNAMFAFACALILGINTDKVTSQLLEYKQMAGRGMIIHTPKYTIIDDAYNASIESMEAAFANLNVVGKNQRKIACLGGMLEMGSFAPFLHEKTGLDCANYDFDFVILTGDNKVDFVRGYNEGKGKAKIIECENSRDVMDSLLKIIKPNDCILFKASNAFGFQKYAEELSEVD